MTDCEAILRWLRKVTETSASVRISKDMATRIIELLGDAGRD